MHILSLRHVLFRKISEPLKPQVLPEVIGHGNHMNGQTPHREARS